MIAGALLGSGCGGSDELAPGSPQASGSYYRAVMALKPSLYWRLDEPDSQTAVTDASRNGNDGHWAGAVVHGQPGAVDGDESTGFRQEGVTYARADDFKPYSVGGRLTVVGWAKTAATTSGFYTLFSSDGKGQPTLELTQDVVRWYSNVQQNYLVGNYDWRDSWPGPGRWVWWAFTWNDATSDGTFYVDGVRQKRSFITYKPSGFVGDEGNFQIGDRGDGDYEVLNGALDDVAVWDRVLTYAQLRALYRAGT